MSKEEVHKAAEDAKKTYMANGDPDLPQQAVFTEFGVLGHAVGKNAEKLGNGIVRILKNPQNGRYRIVMRDKNDLNNIFINHFILPESALLPKPLENGKIVYNTTNYPNPSVDKIGKKEQFNLRFITPELNQEFIAKYQEALEENKKLLK
ncbi:putative Ran-specific GTPase-activating protein [Histomonas meleagridis]|uniref:putative Ran-specific GTPase-activating protein n=1 Tax=Histomonas meleagridis TaxID=135588 RepID=UPI0035593CA2|nr:putative Ran-specific GTPase-activating protein [Histomonas meleagridis]KAH0807098.1 putative Ran-specific GTPase-activating protein [Histomonas meleagridis]